MEISHRSPIGTKQQHGREVTKPSRMVVINLPRAATHIESVRLKESPLNVLKLYRQNLTLSKCIVFNPKCIFEDADVHYTCLKLNITVANGINILQRS